MRGHVGAADATADLVELGEPEHVGALDDERVGLGDVEARLDDRRRDEDVGVAAQEREHPLLQLPLGQLSVRDEEAQLGAEGGELRRDVLDRLDAVVQVERLPAAVCLARERELDDLVVVLADVRADRAAPLRRRLDHRDVAQARQRHVQRARDRRRREREDVDFEPQLAQQLLLRDAEPLLLVDDDEPELLRDHVSRQHAVRSEQHLHLAVGEPFEDLPNLGGLAKPRHHLDVDREVLEPLPECVPVLLGEHGRRRQDQRLLAVERDGEGRADGDLGLAEADVAADQPVHRARRFEILLDGLDRPLLVVGLPVGKAGLELLEPVGGQVERHARGVLPAGVEAEQLAGELANARSHPVLEQLPGFPSQLGERRRSAVRADVPGDLAELLVRDVEPVVAAKGEEQVVAGDACDRLGLEAEQPADTVVLVDDVVARAEVGERLEGAPRPGLRARAPTEHLRSR